MATVPPFRPIQNPALSSNTVEQQNNPRTILLVDDIPENLALLDDVFREHGYGTVLASDGVEALQQLQRQEVSLIVADAMMPKMDGFQLCKEVRRNPAFTKIPLVIYTANYVSDEERAFACSIGVDRYVVKYEGLAALIDAVDELSHRDSSVPGQASPNSPPSLNQELTDDHTSLSEPLPSADIQVDGLGLSQIPTEGKAGQRIGTVGEARQTVKPLAQASNTSGQAEGAEDSLKVVDDLAFLEKHHAIVVRKLEEKTLELEMYAETLARKNRELQASEARYRSFFEHAAIAIFVLDRVSGKVLDVNKEGVRLLGFSKAELREMARLPFVDENGFTTAVLETKNFFTKETIMRRKDGKTVNVDVGVGPVDESENARIMLYVRDVSEQRKMREQLQQAEKVALMGRLAAGIAHEIRNPLSAVTVNLQFLVGKYGTEFIDRDSLEAALEGARRIEEVIKNTLNLARLTPPLLADEQVNNLVHRTLWFLKIPLQQKGIKVQTRFTENLPSITVDAKQIQQVILNLVQNAIDASPVGGVIIISTELAGAGVDARSPSHAGRFWPFRKARPDSTIGESGRTDPPCVVLTIKDSGPGIPHEELEHLFDPFRSTKADGTGLGLALSKQILDRHGAVIEFSSVVGEGTVVKILFPTTVNKNGEPHV